MNPLSLSSGCGDGGVKCSMGRAGRGAPKAVSYKVTTQFPAAWPCLSACAPFIPALPRATLHFSLLRLAAYFYPAALSCPSCPVLLLLPGLSTTHPDSDANTNFQKQRQNALAGVFPSRPPAGRPGLFTGLWHVLTACPAGGALCSVPVYAYTECVQTECKYTESTERASTSCAAPRYTLHLAPRPTLTAVLPPSPLS